MDEYREDNERSGANLEDLIEHAKRWQGVHNFYNMPYTSSRFSVEFDISSPR